MNEYTVELLQRAVQDISDIYQYILKDNPSAAVNIYNEIEKAISDIPLFPLKGFPIDKNDKIMSGYRYIIVKPYLIFYKINENIITVYHVIDGRRDYAQLLSLQ